MIKNTILTMMLEDDDELIKGEILEVIEDYYSFEMGIGYRILKVKGDIEVQKENGTIYIPDTIDNDFVSVWRCKTE